MLAESTSSSTQPAYLPTVVDSSTESFLPDPDSDDHRPLRSESAALKQGKLVAGAEQDFEQELTKLMPMLWDVHDEIAQRATRYTKSPGQTWQSWLKDFLKKTGIKRCSKTIKRRMDSHRPRTSTPEVTAAGSAAKAKSPTAVFKSRIAKPAKVCLDAAPAGKERETAERMICDLTDAIREKIPGISVQVLWPDIDPDVEPTNTKPGPPPVDELRARRTATRKNGHRHVPPAPGPQESNLDAAATGPEEAGDVTGDVESATVSKKEPIPATQPPKSKIAQSACVSIDSWRPAGAFAAGVQVPVNPANPMSAASKLAALVDEVIDCVSLEPTPDGGYKVVAAPAALAKIKKSRKWKKYLLSGPVDLFDESVSFSVIRKILASIWRAQESDFRIFTAHPERMHEYARWEISQYDLWHFPIHLTICVPVQSTLDLHRLDDFANVYHELKSVSFAGFRSDSARPLMPGDVMSRLLACDLREIFIPMSPELGVQDLARADAECMALIAEQRGLGGCVVTV